MTTTNQDRSSTRSRGARAKDTTPDANISGCEIRGARTHNLKGISCRIPFGRLTVITGVSGSGKTSLAFDTLYAEGQRRFVDCLSTYARQFLPRLDRPEVESIGELQPPVAVRQQNLIRNARSTVGSITEVSDYLELVLAHGGTIHCARCDAVAETLELDEAAERLLALPPEARWILAAPIRIAGTAPRAKPKVSKSTRKRRTEPAAKRDDAWSAESLAALGHTRFLVGGEVIEARPEAGPVWLVLDRFTARSLDRQRAHEAIEGAWHLGQGDADLFVPGDPEPRQWLRRGVHCTACGARSERLRPHELSPHSPLGACAACQGFGRIPVIDREKVVPDPRKSLSEGALVPLATKMGAAYLRRLVKAAPTRGVRLDVPYAELTAEEIEWIWSGSRESPGVLGFFRYLERKRYRSHVRIFHARFRGYLPCAECGGARRRREVLAVKLGGRSILDLETMPIGALHGLIERLALSEEQTQAVAPPRRELLARLGYLVEVGLDYLTLARTARTLSGGETQRIRLASGLGSSLSRTLYVLDEPTVGLHASDTARILSVMRHLTARGNTVVVVEHDPEIARAADHLLVLGPSGGEEGGELLYEGAPDRFFTREPGYFSVAAHRSPRAVVRDASPRALRSLTLRGVRCHNLELAELTVPLDRLVVLTGVSGSGKSTLLEDVIWKQAERAAGRAAEDAAEVASVEGLEALSECLLLSQDPLGRSSRSTVVSFAGLLDPLGPRSRAPPSRRSEGSRPGPSPSTWRAVAARCARAWVASPSTCSSWPTSRSPASPAEAGAFKRRCSR
ncbi:MAG: excinuclease ABC subunit A [Candidatus Eisenbacteria bacterium]